MGGRSRVAAQMLSGKGFQKVYNLSGGIKTWDKETAIGDEFAGLNLFSIEDGLEQILVVAYSMEQGLRDFYLSMVDKVADHKAKNILTVLADVEIKHQKSILTLYQDITGSHVAPSHFKDHLVAKVAEGGLSTDQYIALFGPEPTTVNEITALAISIEAQALDLYQRASQKNSGPAREFFLKIAQEEQVHLNMLATLMEKD